MITNSGLKCINLKINLPKVEKDIFRLPNYQISPNVVEWLKVLDLLFLIFGPNCQKPLMKLCHVMEITRLPPELAAAVNISNEAKNKG